MSLKLPRVCSPTDSERGVSKHPSLKLHDYQKKGIAFTLENKTPFLMVDLGLGKTAIALKVIEQLPNPTLVLAPLRTTYATWPEEIKLWTPNQSYTILHGTQKDSKLRLKKQIYLLNYDGLKWFYSAILNKFRLPRKLNLVLDESSFVKSASTQRFKLLRKMMSIFTDYRMCLSATPAPNGLHELWSQYFMLDKGKRLGQTFYSFRNSYFNYSGPPIYKTIPFENTAQRMFDKVKDITFRLDAKDYLKMEPITYNAINLVLTPKLQAQYKEFENEFFLQLEDAEVEVFNAVALSGKLRQFVQGCMYTNKDGDYTKIHNIKIEALKELRESTNQPILCPIQFKFERKQIEKQIKGVPCIAGGTKQHEATVYIREWNKGNLPLLLCHPASLGHGVNLQSGGHILLWLGLTWSLEQYHQMNGRLHRQGQKNAVTIHHLIMRGTIDQAVLRALSNKHITQSGFLQELRRYRNEQT